MSLTYADIGAHLFGERDFGCDEFSHRTGTPRAAKILSELAVRGIVARTARGRYRFLRPSERPDLRLAEWNRVRETVLNGPEPKAWTGSSAVEVWTAGGYLTAPTPYFRVYHVAVPFVRVRAWRDYLARRGVSTHEGKRVGARVTLHGVRVLRRSIVGGEPVIPRSEVVELIRGHPGLYGGAEESLLDR